MDYANADGSVAEMCGNGIRCVGVLAHEQGLVDGLTFDVATRAGVKRLELRTDDGGVRSVTVGMGPANFTLASIPMRGPAWETFLGQPFEIGPDMTLTASAVSMGNPHLVLFVDEDPARYHVGHIGPALERHERFPEGTNVEFARVDGDRIDVRVWERGSGETMACGSGACAVAVAANEAGLAPARVTIRFPGGDARGRAPGGRRGVPDRSGRARLRRDGRPGGPGARMTDDLGRRLAARTLELVDLPSESGDEAAILARLRELVPPARFTVADDGDAALLFLPRARRPHAPLVLLAGHVDTVPAAGNVPGRIDGDAVVGRGASDMKGALAVMLEVADDAEALGASDLDVGLLFVGREELPITESALLPLLERCPAIREADLALVMEPTANELEVGCMGNLNATVRASGRAAHSARPWLGENAIHAAIQALAPLVDLPTRDVEIDGLVFREVVSVTRIEGGGARNVIPDRVEAHGEPPVRAEPHARRRGGAAPGAPGLISGRGRDRRERTAGAGHRPQPARPAGSATPGASRWARSRRGRRWPSSRRPGSTR